MGLLELHRGVSAPLPDARCPPSAPDLSDRVEASGLRPVTPAAPHPPHPRRRRLVAAFALAWGGEGFWVCLPGALVLASAEPNPRAGLAAAALVVDARRDRRAARR